MCRECPEQTWSDVEEEFTTTPIAELTFLENDALDVWTKIVKETKGDQIATFLTELAQWMALGEKSESIHPLIGRFIDTYEKILVSGKKFVLFEHFCSLALEDHV